jgi:hypothetical protein
MKAWMATLALKAAFRKILIIRTAAAYLPASIVHRCSPANTIYELPFGTGKRFSIGIRFGDYASGNWQVNGIFSALSGQHLNITAAGDIANTGNAGTYERADLVGNPFQRRSHPGQSVMRSAIGSDAYPHSVVQPLHVREAQKRTLGNAPRNFIDAPNWGPGHVHPPAVPDQREPCAEVAVEAFNVLNHPVLGNPASSVTTEARFGQISTLAFGNAQRILQFAVKLQF